MHVILKRKPIVNIVNNYRFIVIIVLDDLTFI